MMGIGQRWQGQNNTLKGRQKWPELLHMAEKHLKNAKKTKEKHVKEEGEIMNEERVRRETLLLSRG
jgi:hypothetical protein